MVQQSFLCKMRLGAAGQSWARWGSARYGKVRQGGAWFGRGKAWVPMAQEINNDA